MITTLTRVTRIPLPALFFVSVVAFTLDNAGIDLVLMAAVLAILFWGDCGGLECGAQIAVCFGYGPPPSQGSHAHRTPRQTFWSLGGALGKLVAMCKKTFADVAKERYLLAFAHVSFPGIGEVRKEGNHHRSCPVEYVNDGSKLWPRKCQRDMDNDHARNESGSF